MKKKVILPTIREEVASREAKCFARGDFGYKNVCGSPYLYFGTRCKRHAGHAGKHAALHEVHLTKSNEPTCRMIAHGSIEVQGEEPLILWLNEGEQP